MRTRRSHQSCGFTMSQEQPRFDNIMTMVEREEQAAPPISAFRMMQGE